MNNPFAMAVTEGITTYPKQRAWSYSACSNHATCPKKIKFSKIDRVPDSTPAMERGSQIHKACAARIDHGVDQHLIPDAWLVKIDELRQRKAKSEVQLAFTVDWIPCEWFGAHVWGRVVIDAHYLFSSGAVVQIVEFKTGKVYPHHAEQLRLYALAGFILYPEAQEVRAENWYLDGPALPHAGYVAQRSALPRLKQEFAEFARPLLNDDLYPATPGRHCNWCGFAKAKGGPCDFG